MSYTYGDLKVGDNVKYNDTLQGTITNITKEGHVSFTSCLGDGRTITIDRPNVGKLQFIYTPDEEYENPFEVGMKAFVHSHVLVHKRIGAIPVRNKDGSIKTTTRCTSELIFRYLNPSVVWEVTKVVSNDIVCIYDEQHDEAFYVHPWYIVKYRPYSGDLAVGDVVVRETHSANFPSYYKIINRDCFVSETFIGFKGHAYLEAEGNPREFRKVTPYSGSLNSGCRVKIIDGIYTGLTGVVKETFTDDDIRIKTDKLAPYKLYIIKASQLERLPENTRRGDLGCISNLFR